jgi:hypothetical protein
MSRRCGRYRLEIRLASKAAFRTEIINEFFELIEEDCSGAETESHAVYFHIEEAADAYVRLDGVEGLHLHSMAVSLLTEP